MKSLILATFTLIAPILLGIFLSSGPSAEQEVLRHVVLFKFKDDATTDQVKMICEAFANLPNEISQIKGFEWGENNSPEGLNQGLTHAFVLTFHSDEDRDDYLVHPAHKAFGKKLGPILDKVTVVDYWAK
ncbi:MAG: Dabb family protein [Saprospiraceae bacterium]|nr:Dabb family protein [Saprospiraceae bacterium]